MQLLCHPVPAGAIGEGQKPKFHPLLQAKTWLDRAGGLRREGRVLSGILIPYRPPPFQFITLLKIHWKCSETLLAITMDILSLVEMCIFLTILQLVIYNDRTEYLFYSLAGSRGWRFFPFQTHLFE